jgi:lysophospholipase L1-like esterase
MNICIFGDSITWGAEDTEKGGWAERLKAHCFGLEGEEYVDVYNLGVAGNTTADLLNRFAGEASFRRPDMVVFAIGINDSKYKRTKEDSLIGLEKFLENVAELEGAARAFTDKIVFAGLTRVDEAKTLPTAGGYYFDNENIAEYDDALRMFCKGKDLTYVDLRDAVDIRDLEDGLHPNADGHEKIFDKIRPAVLGFLK